MDPEERLEGLVRTGNLSAAATGAIEAYGPEVLGFLVTLLRNGQDAEDVFSEACEDLWKGLPAFEWRASLRTWFYVLARHAAARLRRSPNGNPRRRAGWSEISEAAMRARSQTAPHLQTDVKERFAAIRDSLDEDDRALLVLRVDRNLPWSDIASVFSTADVSQEALAREAARLRKHFQFVKEEVRRRARAAGLLNEDEP